MRRGKIEVIIIGAGAVALATGYMLVKGSEEGDGGWRKNNKGSF